MDMRTIVLVGNRETFIRSSRDYPRGYRLIPLLGGTSESREIAEALRFQGYDFWVSVASEFAKYFLDEEIPLRYGCFPKEPGRFCYRTRIQVIIDATHPLPWT